MVACLPVFAFAVQCLSVFVCACLWFFQAPKKDRQAQKSTGKQTQATANMHAQNYKLNTLYQYFVGNLNQKIWLLAGRCLPLLVSACLCSSVLVYAFSN
jgi:hypothetical protein